MRQHEAFAQWRQELSLSTQNGTTYSAFIDYHSLRIGIYGCVRVGVTGRVVNNWIGRVREHKFFHCALMLSIVHFSNAELSWFVFGKLFYTPEWILRS